MVQHAKAGCFISLHLNLDVMPFGLLAATMRHDEDLSSSSPALHLVPVNCKFAITLFYVIRSLLRASHIHTAPTPLLPVITSLASAS